jgi:hypothetical protein
MDKPSVYTSVLAGGIAGAVETAITVRKTPDKVDAGSGSFD